ncbi:serine/threonine protein kinase [Microtetraspora niveoalba]|uniref:serine/threonine protein kinase n=1 Tax=Microtetraspora niveoalba TaxID=46175 RepID=UPI0008310309|nr:serine/threonine-protein kinase [Microtetraspora niveoalba]
MAGPDVAPLRPADPVRLGAYDLTGRLGEGGQGVVYLGVGPSGERVAVKWLRSDLAGDPAMRERFLREATSAKRVAPFCTAQVMDTGVEQERPYIVSEYIEGPSLQRRVQTSGPIPGPALHRLAVGTATALAAIHQAGVVHRDLKPANVIMGPDGPRVIDFGIARAVDSAHTLTSQPVGTPSYMSPEQIMGEPAGPPADLFAWGCTIVSAATGRAPFGNDTMPAVINRILNAPPDLGNLGAPLRDVVTACLAKDPRARPTAEQVLLRLLQNSAPGPAILSEAAAAAAPGGPAPEGPAHGGPGHSGPGHSGPGHIPGHSGPGHSDPGHGVPAPGSSAYPMDRPPPGYPADPGYAYPTRPYSPQPYAGSSPYPPPPPSPYPARAGAYPTVPGGQQGGRSGGRVAMAAVAAVAALAVVSVVAWLVLRPVDTPLPGPGPETPSASVLAASPTPPPSPSATPVPTSGLTSVKLPGVRATLYEHPTDPMTLTYYEVENTAKNTWINYPRNSTHGSFTKSTKYWQQTISPDGRLSAGRNKNYTDDDFHGVDIITRATGEVRTVATVKRPLTYEYAEWTRDGDRLLLSIRNPGGSTWTTKGFVVVDVAAGTAKVRQINDPAIKEGRFYWTGDETTVATYFHSGKTAGIRVYDLDGKIVRTLGGVGTPYNTSSGLFSPSGDAMVTECPDARSKVCVWDSDSGSETTRFGSDCSKVLGWWDATHVFCWTTPRSGEASVIVVDLDGTTVRTLLETTQSDVLGPFYTRTGGG